MVTKTEPKTPKFRRHKGTGQGYVELNGRRVYLGRYDLPETREKYLRTVLEWMQNGRRLKVEPTEISIAELIVRYMDYARGFYKRADGTLTDEVKTYAQAFRPLRELYGRTKASDFGPLALRAIQKKMIDLGWCRTNINGQVGRLKHFFKWAASNELIPVTTYQGLTTVPGLGAGRTNAEESEPVKPVPEGFIDAVRPFVSRQVEALINLQLLTGARAGELVIMRAVDIDTSGKVWIFKPIQYKTAYRGLPRQIYIGPRGQEIIHPYLVGRPVDAYLFSPAEAEEERRQKLTEARKTDPSSGNTVGSNRKSHPMREPGDHYTVASYRRAINRACTMANVKAHEENSNIPEDEVVIPIWSPHRLRHNAGTMIRREFGLEGAQVVLGHQRADVTQIYSERDESRAVDIALKIG